MKKKVPAFLGFTALCLMAFGGGNVLRQSVDPDLPYAKSGIYETLGRFIKNTVRGPTGTADATNRNQVVYGSQVYNAQCAECHGNNLQGQANWRTRKADGLLPAPPHAAAGHSWHHSDQELFDYTRGGGQALMPDGKKSGMPAFADRLNDQDIWAVLAFIKSTWPADIQKQQAEKNHP